MNTLSDSLVNLCRKVKILYIQPCPCALKLGGEASFALGICHAYNSMLLIQLHMWVTLVICFESVSYLLINLFNA